MFCSNIYKREQNFVISSLLPWTTYSCHQLKDKDKSFPLPNSRRGSGESPIVSWTQLMKGGAHPFPSAALSFPNSKKIPIYCWADRVFQSSHGEAQPRQLYGDFLHHRGANCCLQKLIPIEMRNKSENSSCFL